MQQLRVPQQTPCCRVSPNDWRQPQICGHPQETAIPGHLTLQQVCVFATAQGLRLLISDAVLYPYIAWHNIFVFQGEWCWHQVLNWMLLGHQVERAECQLLWSHHWYLCLEDCTRVYSITSLLGTWGTSLWSGDQRHKAELFVYVMCAHFIRLCKLNHLNLSYCERLTDMSLEWLSGSSICSLDISGCNIQDKVLLYVFSHIA